MLILSAGYKNFATSIFHRLCKEFSTLHLEEENLPCTILQRDQDTKFVPAFDEVFKSLRCAIKKTMPRSPNFQAFVERVIQTLKHDVLNAICILSDDLNYNLRVSGSYLLRHRLPYQSALPPVIFNKTLSSQGCRPWLQRGSPIVGNVLRSETSTLSSWVPFCSRAD